MDSKAIIGAVQGVTAKWSTQRKAEERHAAARARRWEVMTYRRSITIKDAAYDAIPEAYLKASAGGTLPAKARQVMYAARGRIQELTGKALDDRYFTQTLLPDYIAEHPELTARWKVVFDARGHLVEPHTRRSIPLGTLEVETYLQRVGDPDWLEPSASVPDIETIGPSGRYGAVLFCEKEGFNELFSAVHLGERYDTAIMSTKGVSVTAARRLVDQLCACYQLSLFVLHDFDVSGFTVLKTLRSDTRRYAFENEIEVIDVGLRLEDAETWGLESESVTHRESMESIRHRLRLAGASPEEMEFLLTRRVELNAFSSDKLVAWIEGKLKEHGVVKVIPDEATLAEAYRRELQSAWLRDRFDALLKASNKAVEDLDIPSDLRKRVSAVLKKDPELAWNQAVRSIAVAGGSGEQAE
jgi:Topoisomerase 6 subunit A/Spo11, Toprim domain